MRHIILCLGVVLMTAACQNKQRNKVDYAVFIKEQGMIPKNRVQQFRFQGWQPLDERYLILRSNQRTSYLIKLMSYCNELPFAQSITLDQGSRTTLNSKFDAINVPGQIPQKCTIDTIYEMDRVQKQALLDYSNQAEKMLD